MKVLVPVKRVVDANVKVRVKADGSAVELANVKMAMNPFDEIAVEEAIRLKEAGKARRDRRRLDRSSSRRRRRCAPRSPWAQTVRYWSRSDEQPLSHWASPRCLRASSRPNTPGLVILGKQAIDDDSNQTGQMLAALLGWAQGTFASKIELRLATASR
jgi:electron transfer flavoprotein beta subunit